MHKWLFLPAASVFETGKSASPFRTGACRALWKLSEAGFAFAFTVGESESKRLKKTALDHDFRAAHFVRESLMVEFIASGFQPAKSGKDGLTDASSFFTRHRVDLNLSLALVPLPLALPKEIASLHPGPDWGETVTRVLARPRRVEIHRKTKETDIHLVLNPDGSGRSSIHTGIGFFDHMLEQVARHGGMDLKIDCKGDLHIDAHHTVEDTGIALGEALRAAVGDKRGLSRYGSSALGKKLETVSLLLPMDESLATCALDFSGRSHLVFQGKFRREKVGDLPVDLIKHFFEAVVQNAGINLHLTVRGENDHHQVEAAFKAFSRALRQAFVRSGQELPSTKGVL
ncbi:MAG: imidazoleglycerol-phosphate dehydratase HisB [Spirochaetes bacterium]|nr:imidazoleglycerol-phosphate dehydratase HisB [Spirochaetota bacterium]